MFTSKTMLTIRIILGSIILISSVSSIFISTNKGLFILIIAALGVLALSMNFKYENAKHIKITENNKITEYDEALENNGVMISERNAWDVWFYSMPAAILTLFFVGILANNIEVWKWVAISLGGAVGLESLSAIIKNFRS